MMRANIPLFLGRTVRYSPHAFYPPSQNATGVNPWMNAERVSDVALAKADMLRRVTPKSRGAPQERYGQAGP